LASWIHLFQFEKIDGNGVENRVPLLQVVEGVLQLRLVGSLLHACGTVLVFKEAGQRAPTFMMKLVMLSPLFLALVSQH